MTIKLNRVIHIHTHARGNDAEYFVLKFPAKIVLDRETGRSKGFGFVSFTCVSDAEAAMKATDGTVSFSNALDFTSL
jgi:hypothetical protein